MQAGWFWFLVAPFFLNDFATLYFSNFTLWLAADYASRIIPLWIVWRMSARTAAGEGPLGWLRDDLAGEARSLFGGGFVSFALGFVLLSCVGIFMDQVIQRWLETLFVWEGLGIGLSEPSNALFWFDMTFGLALVALSEEVVFRALAARVFGGLSMVWFYVATSVLFGAVHWSSGPAACLNAALIGCVFMAYYRRTGLLLPVMAAHWAVNFYDFSGLFG